MFLKQNKTKQSKPKIPMNQQLHNSLPHDDPASELKNICELPFPDNIPKWMIDYAKSVIKKYNMDSSHDMVHFKNVANLAELILHTDGEVLSTQEIFPGIPFTTCRNIIIHAAFVHDLIDNKYMDEKTGIYNLVQEFTDQKYPFRDLQIIITLITNMSYSKRKQRIKNGEEQFRNDEYKLALRILADADQLDAYRPERIVTFQNNQSCKKYGAVLHEETNSWAKTIMTERVLKYISDGYMTTSIGKKLGVRWEKVVKDYVDKHYSEVETVENY